MLSEIDYIRIFCEVDDFCKGFERWYVKQLISDGMVKRKRGLQMRLSEIITIMISYYASGMACFKHYYYYLKTERKNLFLNMVHYDSFIRYVKNAFSCLLCMFKAIEGGITEYMFIDATPMAVCHNLREKRHKVFKGMAKKARHLQVGSLVLNYIYCLIHMEKWLDSRLLQEIPMIERLFLTC